MLLNHSTFGQLRQYLRQRTVGLNLRGHGCGVCCPGSGFFRPRSSGAMDAAVQSLAVLGGTVQATRGCHVGVSPSAGSPFGRQYNTPGYSLEQLCWWAVRTSVPPV